MQKNIIQDRLVISPIDKVWTPDEIEGSFYIHLQKKVRQILEDEGDWLWLHNRSVHVKKN